MIRESAHFDFQARTRIVSGAGCVDQVGDLAHQLGGQTILLVTDPGIVAAGHVDRVQQTLDGAGLNVVLFDRVVENPTTHQVDACVESAKVSKSIDLIVGLGGGSSLDTAKGANFLYTNGGRMQDYWGVGKATKPMLPLIAIPTTAGTGSECQSFAVIVDPDTHQKMACGDPKATPAIAILDPELTLTQPPQVAATTGVDAIAHALETAVSSKRNQLSWLYSREAFRLTVLNFTHMLEHGDDVRARSGMQLGAALAGLAIENSMLGAAHAAANPLTSHHGVVHGQAVGIMLPAVIRFNSEDETAKRAYVELATLLGLVPRQNPADQAVDALVARLESLLNAAELPRQLDDLGVARERVPKLAAEAAQQWTANFNPRPVSIDDFISLYEAAFQVRGEGDTLVQSI